MLKRLLIFILIIGGVLYFGLRDDKPKEKTDTHTNEERHEEDGHEHSEEEKKSKDGKDVKDKNEDKKKEVKNEKEDSKKVETKTTTATAENEAVKTEVKTLADTTLNEKVETAANVVVETTPATVVNVSNVSIQKPVVVEKPAYTAQSNVKVYLYDFAIDMSALSVPAGNVTFTVQNTGKFSHNFGIKGGQDFGRVNPGATMTFDTYLTPDTHSVYSSNPRDIERGMEEGLVVSE